MGGRNELSTNKEQIKTSENALKAGDSDFGTRNIDALQLLASARVGNTDKTSQPENLNTLFFPPIEGFDSKAGDPLRQTNQFQIRQDVALESFSPKPDTQSGADQASQGRDFIKETATITEAKAAETPENYRYTGGLDRNGLIPESERLPLIDRALKICNLPVTPANELAVAWMICGESSYNPKAINRTDSNAQQGHPSEGIMQCIPSTFHKYRDKNTVNDIQDPLANMTAGINWAKEQYGGVTNTPGARGLIAEVIKNHPQTHQVSADDVKPFVSDDFILHNRIANKTIKAVVDQAQYRGY